ncbi:hypothetical protein RHMOL_Rhmol09G0096000 [Rhododendron molle]|uniref:Uncharacterized protein n=1 Tax=Rhododendron molle TaxID=49168 RepID=A0ACC0MBT2_RHOML|nr:hypothetical protein RHMOL_Rhmol09G0096000 [Rhododendron molle]
MLRYYGRVLARGEGDCWILESVGVVGLRGIENVPSREQLPGVRTLPRAMIWGPLCVGKKKSRKGLMDFGLYLDELSSTQVDWDPWVSADPEPEYLARSRVVAASRVLLESAFGWQWYLGDRVTRQSLGLTKFLVPRPLLSRASHTDRYMLAELPRFIVPEAASSFTRPGRDYAIYQRQHLARPLGVIECMAVQNEALEAGQERQCQRGRSSRSRERNVYAAATGLPQLSWTLAVWDSQGEEAMVHHELARTEPAEITGPVPVEWGREVARLILAMEKAFHKIAGGTPFQLHYPPTALAPAVQPQRELRKRPAQKKLPEGPTQKKRREKAKEKEEEEEDEQLSRSSDFDSASDPRFQITPRDLLEEESEEDNGGTDPEDFED